MNSKFSKQFQSIVRNDMADPGSSDHIYVDLSVINNKLDGTSQPLNFTDLRNSVILENPNDYYMTVCRFHIDTFDALPLFIPQIDTTQSDPNKSIYSFTLKYKTYFYQAFMQFAPQNLSVSVPQAPNIAGQVVSNGYYYINSYSYAVNLFNTTLKTAYNGLASLVVAGGDTLPTSNAPWLLYDPTSGDMVFNSDLAGYDSALTYPIEVYLNPPALNLFASFEYMNCGQSSNGMNYKLNIYNNNSTNIMELSTYNCLQMYQQYPCVSIWNPVQSVILVSPTLPIQPSIVSEPIQFNSITKQNTSSQNVTMNIITDFEVALSTGNLYLPSINFIPFQYRLIDMIGHQDVKTINIQAYWKDIYSNYHVFNLANGGNADLKIAFIKKGT